MFDLMVSVSASEEPRRATVSSVLRFATLLAVVLALTGSAAWLFGFARLQG